MQRAKRFPFTDKENRIIVESVRYLGEDWEAIAKKLSGRTPKQVHDRYINYLRQGLTNEPWTKSEDEILMNLYKMIGPKWSKMMPSLPGRSGNNIKNRWHKHLMKNYFEIERKKNELCSEKFNVDYPVENIFWDGIDNQILPSNNVQKMSTMNVLPQNRIVGSFSGINDSNNTIINSNDIKEIEQTNKVQFDLQNFDFEKLFNDNFTQINSKNNNQFHLGQIENKYSDQQNLSAKLFGQLDIEKKMNNDYLKSNQKGDQKMPLFNVDIVFNEIMEELNS